MNFIISGTGLYLIMALLSTSLIINDIEYFLIYLSNTTVHMSYLEKDHIQTFGFLQSGCLFFLACIDSPMYIVIRALPGSWVVSLGSFCWLFSFLDRNASLFSQLLPVILHPIQKQFPRRRSKFFFSYVFFYKLRFLALHWVFKTFCVDFVYDVG